MGKAIETTQYLLSLVSGSFFVICNLMVGWGTFEAQRLAIPVLTLYNVMDIMLGRYWDNDKLMCVHHSAVVAFGSFIYLLNAESFTDELYQISYWASLGEISTIFNCLRWFFYGTEWEAISKIAFGTVFLIVRPISNIGLLGVIDDFYESEGPSLGYYLFLMSCLIYTSLNLHWARLIVLKMYRQWGFSFFSKNDETISVGNLPRIKNE
jgi:hypothetical protein